MKNYCFGLILLLGLVLPASAQVSILNYTGEEIKVDVLHAKGQARDVVIKNSTSPTAPIGPVNPRRTSMVLVLKKASGQELTRGEVYSEALVVVSKDHTSLGYGFGQAGFFKGKAEHGYIKILNATQQDITYSYEEPNFTLRQGKVENDFPSLRDWVVVLDGPYSVGQSVKVKMGFGEANQENMLTAGGVYFATSVDGKLKLTKVSND